MYTYGKTVNRTKMRLINQTRVTKETYGGGVWTQVERWNYTYNIDNRLTQVEKRTGTGSGTYAGKEMYQYCLSCDGAMSTWRTFGLGSQTYPTAWRQYEYDGLNLLRVDERCDTDKDGLIEAGETTWRTVEVNTHKPGALGALVGKRVYVYSDAADSSPNSSNDYTYTYDALGNVQVVYRASGTIGEEKYFFTQDAFGNELSSAAISDANKTNLLGGATWAIARTAGITEHQTGKIQSAFSGLQHFGARWYDPLVGRFVSRDPIQQIGGMIYSLPGNNPVYWTDETGNCSSCAMEPTPAPRPSPVPVPGPTPGPIPIPSPPIALICLFAPHFQADSGICNLYEKNDTYLGFNARCVCENTDDSPWSMTVRGCLACIYLSGVDSEYAHRWCYALASRWYGKSEEERLKWYIGTQLMCKCGWLRHFWGS